MTSDVLGSVVDSINVMVGEIGDLIKDVRQAAHQVSASASEMIVSMEADRTARAQAQAREAMRRERCDGGADPLGAARGR